jgi:transcriptional regulator with XRE-family HTH domain
MSQAELARLSGYKNRSAICQIESGAMTPSSQQMRRISEVLGVPVVELFPELEPTTARTSGESSCAGGE